jgi:DtxR family Mn-dependent transcriptional regulator
MPAPLAFALGVIAALAGLWLGRALLVRWRQARRLAGRALVEDALKHIQAREATGTFATPESLAGQLRVRVRRALELISAMEAGELVQSTGPGLRLTAAGRELALRVIRAHRLLERYLADELRMPLQEIHAAADRREHRLTEDEANELEARLGYPQTDPHGDPIPTSGGALTSFEATALTDWEIGRPARIVHLEDEPPEALAAIVAAGFAPGMQIEVRDVTKERLAIWDGAAQRELSPWAASYVFVSGLAEPLRPPLTLAALAPGHSGRVIALRSEGLERRRLLDLGLTPGTVVERVMTGPLGEPTAYRVRGALIALRTEQAERIEIQPLTGDVKES